MSKPKSGREKQGIIYELKSKKVELLFIIITALLSAMLSTCGGFILSNMNSRNIIQQKKIDVKYELFEAYCVSIHTIESLDRRISEHEFNFVVNSALKSPLTSDEDNEYISQYEERATTLLDEYERESAKLRSILWQIPKYYEHVSLSTITNLEERLSQHEDFDGQAVIDDIQAKGRTIQAILEAQTKFKQEYYFAFSDDALLLQAFMWTELE